MAVDPLLGLHPVVILMIGIALGGVLELGILWFAGRRWIPKKNAEVYNRVAQEGGLDQARDHFIAPIREEMARLEAHIDTRTAGLEARTQESMAELETMTLNTREELEAKIGGMEERLQTVQIDPGPLLEQIDGVIVPRLEDKVEHIKAVLRGKMGYAVKGLKQLGEGVAERVGEEFAAESLGGEVSAEDRFKLRLQSLGMDEEWVKNHPVAAFGLELLRESQGGSVVKLPGRGPSPASTARSGSRPYGMR